MKHALGYLKYTQHHALHYNEYPTLIERYIDENWITGSNKLKSTSGYVFILTGGAVSLKSSKKTFIAHSTMKYEH